MKPVLLVVLAAAALLQDAPDEPDVPDVNGLRERLAALDTREGAEWGVAFRELTAAGDPAAALALEGFETAAFAARRARARLVAEIGSPASVAGVLALLEDPDPGVRRHFVTFLGALSLAEEGADERVVALVELATEDPDRRVRRGAVDALSGSALPGAVAALDELLDAAPPGDALHVAHALGELPAAGRRLVARVQAAFAANGARLPVPVLAVLLEDYGEALADLPRGGADPRDRVPFVLGRRHPSSVIQRAAWLALERFLARLAQLGELERVDSLLAALAAEGFEPPLLLYRRAKLALAQHGDAEEALVLAKALERAADGDTSEDSSTWRFYALHLEGAALFARGAFDPARERFQRATQLLRERLTERLDLAGEGRRSPVGGEVMADLMTLVALEEMWQGLCLLARDRDLRDPAMLDQLRQAHQGLLRARVMAFSSDAQLELDNLDVLFDRDLSPWPLLLSSTELEPFREGRGLDLMLALARAMASIAPWEMPGFEPVVLEDPTLANPLVDPQRYALLERLRQEHLRSLYRLRGEVREEAAIRNEEAQLRIRPLTFAIRQIEFYMREEGQKLEERAAAEGAPLVPGRNLDAAEMVTIYQHLASYLRPSYLALSMGANLRAQGRFEEARRLGNRMIADLRGGLPGAGPFVTEWLSARAELMIGSTYMDEGAPNPAEEQGLAAVRRLEALENSLTSQRDASGEDPEQRAGLAAMIERTRRERANALLSLAVNANVRMGDPDRALGYFERAYELDQRDFMQVLLACYRARSGQAAEARAVLKTVEPSPPLYYNLACTHALLGEADAALDYLRREFAENHPSAGGLARQKAWAREDPDLASLRGDPRFERLVE